MEMNSSSAISRAVSRVGSQRSTARSRSLSASTVGASTATADAVRSMALMRASEYGSCCTRRRWSASRPATIGSARTSVRTKPSCRAMPSARFDESVDVAPAADRDARFDQREFEVVAHRNHPRPNAGNAFLRGSHLVRGDQHASSRHRAAWIVRQRCDEAFRPTHFADTQRELRVECVHLMQKSFFDIASSSLTHKFSAANCKRNRNSICYQFQFLIIPKIVTAFGVA